MAKYLGPRGKIVRRLDYPVFESLKFASPKRNYPPGQHGSTLRRKVSTYGLQLREKQRIKHLYSVLERQFRNYFRKAAAQEGPTGHNLLIMLESRLDNTLYRMGFASTRRAARQMVSHKHFLNFKIVQTVLTCHSNFLHMIRAREKGRKLEIIHNAMRRITDDNQMPWLELDKARMTGGFLIRPQRDEIPEEVNEQLVVELYSK